MHAVVDLQAEERNVPIFQNTLEDREPLLVSVFSIVDALDARKQLLVIARQDDVIRKQCQGNGAVCFDAEG